MTDPVVAQPSCPRILVHQGQLQRLALYNSVEKLPDVKELPIVEILCRTILGLVDSGEFAGQHAQQLTC